MSTRTGPRRRRLARVHVAIAFCVTAAAPRAVLAQSAAAAVASAQPQATLAAARPAATFFPGSLSVNSGFASPLEDENLITSYSLEQGFTLIRRGSNRLVPYLTVLGAGDRAGLDWNNKVVMQGGLKYARGFRSGVVQVGGGYAHESRFISGTSQGRALWFGNYWFGWNASPAGRRTRRLVSAFPGSSWATVGTPAPTEQRNVIGMAYIEQGIAVLKVSRAAVIPFVEHMLALDSAKRPWNNRQTVGEGVRLRVPIGRGTIELTGVYKHERRWIARQSRGAATASVNFWYGWDPSRGR